MFDRFGQIAFKSQIAAAILGNATTREFVLIDPSGPIPDMPRAAFAVELDDAALGAIEKAWVGHLAARIVPYLQRPADDSVQFLRRLYALEDSRKE